MQLLLNKLEEVIISRFNLCAWMANNWNTLKKTKGTDGKPQIPEVLECFSVAINRYINQENKQFRP